ncbi:MAG: hypothetical protein ACLPKB_24800 [Xanthobacteraceae bacterium]
MIEGDRGRHDILVLEKYEAPAGDDGGGAPDPFREYDLWVANGMMALLKAAYPGHFWACQHDTRQRIAKIGIPILMGVSNWMVINLKTHELTPGLVIASGGEILERYRLPRGRLEIGSFLDARARHSALVVPSRKVPT